jgi:purine-nucleoside phosphorylase
MAHTKESELKAPLDAAVDEVWRELRTRKVHAPQALFVMGTGLGLFPERLEHVREIELASVPGVPEPWRAARLVSGRFDDLDLWTLEDRSLDETNGPAWTRAFPCWLAAAAGARVALVATAGASVSERVRVGSLMIANDHIDFANGRTLEGLARSKRGPLFPDQSRLHVEALRNEALALASEVGIELSTGVVAALAGPHLETPAEARFLELAGADVSVQGLGHLLAGCVHAGLGVLVVTAVASRAGQPADLRRILEVAERQAPAIEDLALRLCNPIAMVATELARSTEDV